jgi:hypothetical protein
MNNGVTKVETPSGQVSKLAVVGRKVAFFDRVHAEGKKRLLNYLPVAAAGSEISSGHFLLGIFRSGSRR